MSGASLRRRATASNRTRAQSAFLVAGFICLIGLAINIAVHLGWIAGRVPVVSGFGARWGLTLAAAVCFVFAWYTERLNEKRRH